MGSGGETNRSLDSVHQPVVTVNNYVLDADATSGILSPAETRRVSDWLDAMQVGYGDQVAIDDTAAGNSRGARDTVAMLLARKGMLLAANAPITGGTIASGSIRVVVTRADARVPGCPDWGTRSATNFSNSTTSNYGCASNANLAAMVADANDLVRGQGTRGNDPLAASRAINTYRAATPTGAAGLPASSTNSAGGGR
jgi:pilus assembly protein CpaD